MAILKNKTKRENYLVVSKIFLQDRKLTLTERGLLATLHSFPDEWDFSIRGLAKIVPDGEDKIRRAVEGLINKGYLRKKQDKTSDGRFSTNVIEIYERPLRENPLPEKPISVDTASEKLCPEKPISEKLAQ